MPALRPGQSVVGDTAANWTVINPILQKNIFGIESDTKRVKLGDGSTAWTSLTYMDEVIDTLTVDISGATNGYVLTKGASSIVAVDPLTIGVTDHGGLTGLGDDDHTQYILHSLATAANDFLVASGVGVFAKQTLAQVKSTLGLGSAAYTASSDYAVSAKGVTNGDAHDHSGGDGGQIDHGALSGLSDDDHPQYLLSSASTDFVLVDGSRDITGHIKGANTEPTDLQHLTSWSYVQRIGYNTPWRKPCVAATTCNIDIVNPPSAIDGVTLANGDRILVWQQTNAKENGIYEVSGV